VRFATFIFARIDEIWVFTVLAAVPSVAASSAFVSPSHTSCSTSCSRCVSEAVGEGARYVPHLTFGLPAGSSATSSASRSSSATVSTRASGIPKWCGNSSISVRVPQISVEPLEFPSLFAGRRAD
jgi:hypothetical protein